VGCGSGAHFDLYGEGVEKFGCEPAVSALPALRSRNVTWIVHLQRMPCGEVRHRSTLDVIEHIERPASFIEALDRSLAPAIVIGNIESVTAR
jgi:hypothetical protein